MRPTPRTDHAEAVDFGPFTEVAPVQIAAGRTFTRRPTRQILVGKVPVGGNAPIAVQSMTKTDTRDATATVEQIWALEAAGCEIVRIAVPDADAAAAVPTIRAQIRIPLVVDIHFDYRLALACLETGVDCLRINPGNIGPTWRVREVTRAAAERRVPIRIGVNAGSLEKHLLQRFGEPTAEAMVESALLHIRILEELNYPEMKVSLKASDPRMMIAAYRMLADRVPYPFHLGVTEAGTAFTGAIKSAVGIGTLLAEGIGDTIRVSLTEDPPEEIKAGFEILKALGLRQRGLNVIACPSCGRVEIDLVGVTKEVERRLGDLTFSRPLTVAVMGCAVNGPGEARGADIGIAGGNGVGILIRKGQIVRKVKESELAEALVEEVRQLAAGPEKD
ncbi:MAG: flavodoxin-dependent (E)-4-hydroxy-3-methylbut-2-enyl-diphosphate synthase [candidate division NC10 bacterium]|nr:flavodoxin-dependent (E)-4-hydroxy-3-methylbut-2-enyl-diphosphate synthase [candidate division NC10 bacterium]